MIFILSNSDDFSTNSVLDWLSFYKKNRELIIYPNPASNKITIESNTIYNHFCIFNLYGQQILEGVLQNNEINISELSKGLFILKLANDKEYVQVKFIKE